MWTKFLNLNVIYWNTKSKCRTTVKDRNWRIFQEEYGFNLHPIVDNFRPKQVNFSFALTKILVQSNQRQYKKNHV